MIVHAECTAKRREKRCDYDEMELPQLFDKWARTGSQLQRVHLLWLYKSLRRARSSYGVHVCMRRIQCASVDGNVKDGFITTWFIRSFAHSIGRFHLSISFFGFRFTFRMQLLSYSCRNEPNTIPMHRWESVNWTRGESIEPKCHPAYTANGNR